MRTLLTICLALGITGLSLRAQKKPDPEFVVEEAVFHLPLERLDPHVEFWLPWDSIYRTVFETPLRCDDSSDVLTLRPELLAELPTLSDGGHLLTLEFRPNIRFQDDPCFPDGKGRLVTAHDFAWVLKRHIDPRTRSPYYQAYLEGFLVGARRARAKAKKEGLFDYDAPIPGIKVTDPNRIELRFHQPCARFPSLLTMTWLALMPREAVNRYGSGAGAHPVGTGPYALDKEKSDGDKLTFRRRDNYWNRGAGGDLGPLPRNRGVVFCLLPDLEKQEKRFRFGELTIMDVFPIQARRILNKRGRLVPKLFPRGTQLLRARDDKLQYISFNTTNRILGKKKVRQALVLALDRPRILRRCFAGHADLAQHLCPPAIPLGLGDIPSWEYGKRDLKRARKLLAEAGYPGGRGMPEFVLETSDNSDWEKSLGEMLAQSWARIGVRIQLRLQTYPELKKRAGEGLPEIAINYWQSDYPDPDNFFMMLLRSSWPARDKSADAPNVGFYFNETYEKLYQSSQALPNGRKRGAVFRDMIKLIQEDCPWVFLGHQRQLALVQKGVHGVYSRSRFAFSHAMVWKEAGGRRR